MSANTTDSRKATAMIDRAELAKRLRTWANDLRARDVSVLPEEIKKQFLEHCGDLDLAADDLDRQATALSAEGGVGVCDAIEAIRVQHEAGHMGEPALEIGANTIHTIQTENGRRLFLRLDDLKKLFSQQFDGSAPSTPTPQAPGEEGLIKQIIDCFHDFDLDALGHANAHRLARDLVLLFRRLFPSADLIAAAKAEDCWQCSKPKGSFSNPYRTFATAKETAILSGAHVTVGKDLDALPDRLRQMGFFVCENQTTMADALLSMDLHEAATFIKRTALRSAGGE